MKRFALAGAMLLMCACQSARVGGEDGKEPSSFWIIRFTEAIANISASTIIRAGGAAVTTVGILCFVAAIAVLIFMANRKLAGLLFTCAGACTVGGAILIWVGGNLWWIALLAGLVAAGVTLFIGRKHVGTLERWLGLNLNGNPEIGK